MRKIILLITLIITVNCCTDFGEGKFHKYTIKNESGKDIIISSYRNSYPERNTPIFIQLENGAELTKTYQDQLPPTGYDFAVFFQGDSIIINYENVKTQKYDVFDGLICEQNSLFKSPFCETGSPIQTFIFTEEDYQNAEDCNGNCD